MSLSRSRLFQKKNTARGMCLYHAHRPIVDIGMCQPCADKWRAKRGIFKPHPKKTAWDQVDFSKTNLEISQEMNVTLQAVTYQRKKRGLPVLSARRGRPRKKGAP